MNIVAHNLVAMNALRHFNITGTRKEKVAEKLSSGYRINRAADDAAGLAISEKMRRQIRGLNQGAQNIQEGIGYFQVADGALNEVQEMLHRLEELAVKSANGTNSKEDREYIDSEVQQIKEEMDRIFDTTTYNERKIWEVTGTKKLLGTERKRAITSTTSSGSVNVTNATYDKLAVGSYLINADDTGISISWTSYANENYETEKIDWDTLEANNYSFEMSDYFDSQAAPELFDDAGNPLFKKKISFRVQEGAERQDIIASLNGTSMNSYTNVDLSLRYEDPTGASKSGAVTAWASDMNYSAAYASKANSTNGRDFDAADDDFFEPEGGNGAANLIAFPSESDYLDARDSDETWTFAFELEGVGRVTATSTKVTYGANERGPEDEGTWWEYYNTTENGKPVQKVRAISYEIESGALGDVMNALTGAALSGSPGVLSENYGGSTNGGGYINIRFEMKADNAFSYGNTSSDDVGYFTLQINVNASDTEQSVLDKINDSLNADTVLDFYSYSGTSDSASIGSLSPRTVMVDAPIWGGACDFWVQAGPEANQRIDFVYDSLSLLELKLEDTNVMTVDDANDAIDDVKNALRIVSEQRSLFGAYQNRLEHAYKVNQNIEENTQAAESLIRDTDMAAAMMEYAQINILSQAGQAVLAQANQSNQGILKLLE